MQLQRSAKNTQKKQSGQKKRAYVHIYTTISDFTKVLLHALLSAESELFIREP